MDVASISINEYQSSVEDLNLSDYPLEVVDLFYDFFYNVPYIRNLTSPNRKRAKDLERDLYGRIIVSLTNPHILEDMDYFRPAALHYMKYGKYTDLRPNPNPNSEYYKWMKEETRRCLEGYVRESDGEWITGDYYFFLNYCPMSLIKKNDKGIDERVIGFPDVWEGHYLCTHYQYLARQNGHHGAELASRAKGKAHPYSQVVYTPEGKKLWGDILVGDLLFTEYGLTTKVIDIPFDLEEDIYNITLSDGRLFLCTSGHLFSVYDSRIKETKILTLLEIIYNNYKDDNNFFYYIPNNNPVDWDKQDTDVDPYEFGMDLMDSDLLYIPDCYKYNSLQVRRKLIDGILNAHSRLIRSTSKTLINDVKWILHSLGINNYIEEKECNTRKGIKHYYDIHIYKENKRGRYSYRRINNVYYSLIVNIELSHVEKAKCVYVDNMTHLYLIGDFIVTHNTALSAAMLAKRFKIGESSSVNKKVISYTTASEKKYLTSGDQILNKFSYIIDFLSNNMEWSSLTTKKSLNDMQWISGYVDSVTKVTRGTLNAVIGVTSNDSEAKLRGTRAVLYIIEEFGSFSRLLPLYSVLRPSVEQDSLVYGLIWLQGTSGDSLSDFAAAQELVYNPLGYNIQEIENVYDKEGLGKKYFTYFFPNYVNRANCYNKDGVSNVTKALLELLHSRYITKHNSTDITTITKEVAERPITPLEAMIKSRGNIFPVTMINERLAELDSNPNEYDDVYVGSMYLDKDGKAEFHISSELPIRDFPLKSNKFEGALEIFCMPEKNSEGKVFLNRYIASHDPVDLDLANTASLSSTFVLDLWTDRIVAEYTGRHDYAELNYELVRLLCMYYNCQCLYENNIRGMFAYFQRLGCLNLLADTPEYLKDKLIIKDIGFGNSLKGVRATVLINNYANLLIKDWLMKPVDEITTDRDGNEINVKKFNLNYVRNRAFLRELSLYNPLINVDRIRSFGLLMIFREHYNILYGGDYSSEETKVIKSKSSLDDYFTKNYDDRFMKEEINNKIPNFYF